ncbi:MAG: OmpA family protein [Planctomycetota bacterium]
MALSCVVAASSLVGCKSNQSRGDLVLQEASDLRVQNATLKSQRDSAEQARREAVAELQAMRDQLSAVNDALEQSQREMAALRAQPAPATTVPASAGPNLGDLGNGVSVSTRAGDVVITVAGDVLFDSGKASLRDESKRTLDGIARTLLRRYPGATYRVEGYTDTDPIRKSGWKSNEHLSAERAIAVEKYLVGRVI